MASAFKDRQGWIADFRGYNAPGRKRSRVRVPSKHLVDNEEVSANLFANECEKYCRYIEINPTDIDAVLHAHRLGAINADVRDRLVGMLPVNDSPWGELTILDAALQHPTVAYERTQNEREYLRHRKELTEFLNHTQINLVSQVSLPVVQEYTHWLRINGYSFDGIRHRLMYLRCACRVGATYGIQDTLTGWRLNRQEATRLIDTWSLDELTGLLVGVNDPKVRAVILLGGFMGLRSSEIIRIRCSDITGDALLVGATQSKNKASRRLLPIPSRIKIIISQIMTSAYLISRPKSATMFDPSGFDHWMHPYLGRAPKMLRKAFASWAVDVLSPRHLESFLGHSSGLVGAVTSRHYLAKVRLQDLQGAALQIDAVIPEI